MPGGPSKGWLERIFGRREELTPNQKRERARRRKQAVKGAFKGYKRSGGIWDKLKRQMTEGARHISEATRD